MEKPKRSGLLGAVAAVFRGVDLARRLVLNFIFFGILIVVLALVGGGGAPVVPDSTVLVVAPRGLIVEQLTGDPTGRAIDKLLGEEMPETLLSDLEKAIRAAGDDDRVKVLLLDLNQLAGAGLSKLQAIRSAVDDFKTSGKPVIATADFYGKSQYFLATAADEIYLHHMGLVLLDGYSRFRRYYKDGLDRAEIDWNVFWVGDYKSATEPYRRNDMSEKARDANRDWLGDLWDAYLVDVAAARNLTPAALKAGIEDFNEHLGEAGGQGSEVALRLGLIDHVGDRDAVRDRLIELVGEDEDTHSFHRIGYRSYLEAVDTDRNAGKNGDTVAVVIARGVIQNGHQPPGTIGGDSLAGLIRKARHDEEVKAIVLRVDSPGGSAFASEVIRRELVLAREAGKKVVVSMGSVAASGGYWISTASDEIWASPNTITGSIGIYAMIPTFQKPLAKHLGTHVEGVGTTWLSGALRPDRELDQGIHTTMQLLIEQGYQDFLERVAEARDMTVEEVHVEAQGRVWSGLDAHAKGLVDHLGGLEEAIASAAALAEMGDDYRVRTLQKELDFEDRMLVDFLTWASTWYEPQTPPPSVASRVADFFVEQAEELAQLDDPFGIYAHCQCEVE